MVVSVLSVPFLILLYSCIDFSKYFPASFSRYFCVGLLGESKPNSADGISDFSDGV